MSDPAAALNAAIEAALRASTDLAGIRIYNGVVPERASPLPYVIIGEDQVIGDDEECTTASEVFATVHAWSKPEPPSATEARDIGAAIRAALTASLTVTGHEVVDFEFQDARYNTDSDGSTHMAAVFHYFLTPSV